MIIEKVNRKAPSKLNHYTNLDSLIGIISNNELWLSNLFFQNDKNEYEVGMYIFRQELKRRKTYYIKNKKETVFLNSLGSALNHLLNMQAYTISFSEESDLLSQWRGYADNCRGVRIEFTNLDLLKTQGIQLLPCIYKPQDHEAYIKYLFDKALEIFHITKEEGITNKDDFLKDERPYSDAIQAAGSYFISTSNVACSIIKDSAFREECEWRLINFKKNIAFYRAKHHYIVPYIKMKISNMTEIITNIMLCTSPEIELSSRSVKFMLEQNRYLNTSISQSNIPYRL